jgi:hypothetical protein
VGTEAEESPLFRFVTGKRLGRLSVCVTVNCKESRLAMALQLLVRVVTSRVLKWSINRVTNPNTVQSLISENINVLHTADLRYIRLV